MLLIIHRVSSLYSESWITKELMSGSDSPCLRGDPCTTLDRLALSDTKGHKGSFLSSAPLAFHLFDALAEKKPKRGCEKGAAYVVQLYQGI